MLAIAHRGCADQYPENTIPAIIQSAPHVDLVEIDIKRCNSGELVLFHDDDLGDVTRVSGQVTETNWEVISELRVHDTEVSIPRLDSVVDEWPAGTGMNLDIHNSGIVREALEIISELEEFILVSSSSPDILREIPPEAPIEYGLSFYQSPSANIELAKELGCSFVHLTVDLALQTDAIEEAHQNGLKVDVWTIDKASLLMEVAAVGADAATVDRCDIL